MTESRAKPAVIWLTGLPCAGKSTLAQELWRRICLRSIQVEYLDGDLVREKLPQIGFRRQDREAYLHHIGFLCSVLERQGITVVAAFVSPYRDSRETVRSLCTNFIEVHVATPPEICERRDTKGMYARARRGEIQNFTGVDDPYEPPQAPDIVVDPSRDSVERCAEIVIDFLSERGFL